MREIQCSNVSVSLKTERLLCIQARLNGFGDSGSCMNNSIWYVGTTHAMCGQTLRLSGGGGGNLQARLELRFDSGIYWSCPETLWSVLIGAWAYKTPLCFWKAWLSPTYGTSSHLPLWEPQNMGPAAAPNTIELGLSGQGQQWDCWGGQISCQLKQKLLKMVKQLRKNTLPICLASLG